MKLPAKCIVLILFFQTILISTGCKKILGIEELTLSGKITDDITNVGISGGGYIKVDGYNGNATGFLATDRKEDIGEGKINGDGSFTVRFSKWDVATSYAFYFYYPNNGYINNGNDFLNTLYVSSGLFANGSYSTNITAVKLSKLQLSFRNISPVNGDDSLKIIFPDNNVHFYYLFAQFENLQNCTIEPPGIVKVGINANGILKCNVPSDRKFQLKWITRKNGVARNFSDSIYCPRNTTTIYNLDY